MPITTRKALHGSVGPAIKYITQDKKTENQKYVSSNNCGIATAEEEMDMIQRKFHQKKEPQFSQENFESTENIEENFQESNKDIIDEITSSNRKSSKGNKGEPRTGYHIIQSFPLEDDVSYDEAHEMGVELAKDLYPNYLSVIATHTDRTHVHNHIIMNSIDMNTGKKLEDRLSDKEGSLYSLRKKSNEIAQKHGYSTSEEPRITTYKKRNYAYKPLVWKDILLGLVDYLLTVVKTLKDFLSELSRRGFDIKDEDEISIKHKSSKNYTRLDKISGGVYSKNNLEKFFELGAPSSNGEPLIKYFPNVLKNESSYFNNKKETVAKEIKDLKDSVRLKEKNIVKDYNDLLNKTKKIRKENYEDVVDTDSNFLSNLNNLINFDNSNDVLDISDEEFASRLNEILSNQNNSTIQDTENKRTNLRKAEEEKSNSFNLFDGSNQEYLEYLYIPSRNDYIESSNFSKNSKDDSINIHIPFINKNISVMPNQIHQIPFSFYKDFSFLKVEMDESVMDVIGSFDEVIRKNTNKTLRDLQPTYKNLVGDNQIINSIDRKITSLKKELNDVKLLENIQENNSLSDDDTLDKSLDVDNKKAILSSKINYYQQKQRELYSYLLKEDINSYEELAEKNYSISKENFENTSKMDSENKKVMNFLEERIHLNNYLKLKQTERSITNILEIRRNGNEKVLDNFINSYKDSINKYLDFVKILIEDVIQNHQTNEKENENLKNILSIFEKNEDTLFKVEDIKDILTTLLDDKNNGKTSQFFKKEIKNIAKVVSQELKSYNKVIAKSNRNIKNNSLLNQIILSKNDYISFKNYEDNSTDNDKSILTKVKTDIDILLKTTQNLKYSNLFFENSRNNMQDNVRNLLPILDDTNNYYYLIPLQDCVFENNNNEFNEPEFNKKVNEFNEKKKQNASFENEKNLNNLIKNNEDDYEILEENFDSDLLNVLSNLNNNLNSLNNSINLDSEESYLDENFLNNLTNLNNSVDKNKGENLEQDDNTFDKVNEELIDEHPSGKKENMTSLEIKVLLNPNENYCKVSKDTIKSLIKNNINENINEQSTRSIVINLESIDSKELKFESFDETIKHINIEDNNTDNRQIDTEIELDE